MPSDLALDATIRSAAQRGLATGSSALEISPGDLREKIRAHRAPISLGIVVDNSYSVHAEHMVEKAKGLAWALLDDAATSDDRVALVAFHRARPEATVALPLTRSRTRARRRLESVPLSGRTPLASAVRLCGRILQQERLKRSGVVPLAVVITDGLPTIALRPGGDALADLLAEARVLRRHKITTVVVDGSDQDVRLGGCGRALADAAGGTWLRFDDLVAEWAER